MQTLSRTSACRRFAGSRILGSAALAVAALAVLAGCSIVSSSSPSSFYVLDSALPQGQQPLYAQGDATAPTVAITNTRVSPYLDRPQVTVRLKSNEVRFDEFVRWAEPLSDGLTRTLRTNMVTLLGTPDSALPWTRSHARDFNLFVQLEDVYLDEGKDGKTLEVRLSYRMNEGRGSGTVAAGEQVYRVAVPSSSSADTLNTSVARLISEQVGIFSVDVAKEIARLSAERAAAKKAQAEHDAQADKATDKADKASKTEKTGKPVSKKVQTASAATAE